MLFNRRIIALMIKEMLALVKDPKGRTVLIGPPIMQLLVFAFAATLEVKNASVVVLNQDIGRHGTEIVNRINGSPTFSQISFVQNVSEFKSYIDQQKAIVALHIPQDFSREIESGSGTQLQTILDGRRSNASQIVSGYISRIVNDYEQELMAAKTGRKPLTVVVVRNWFNENLTYTWFTVPSLVGIISMVIGIVVTALSVARERELGTFDQLLVSPLKPYEILIGKTAPALIISMSEGLLIWSAAVFAFGIPFYGSFLLLLLVLVTFLTSVIGVGLFISSLSKTQQQAILGGFVFLVPAITLSGYAAPVENMPVWLQHVTWFNPLKHALVVIRGLFLKDMPLPEVWSYVWPMLVIGVLTLSLASHFFARKLE